MAKYKRKSAPKLELDSNRLHELLVLWQQTGTVSDELVTMFGKLVNSLLHKPSYIGYDDDTKADMQSEATYQFLRYSHNYKPERSKSANPAFTFLAWNAECSFKKILKRYYKHKNLETALDVGPDLVEQWHTELSNRLIDQRDSDETWEESIDSWSHDELSAI